MRGRISWVCHGLTAEAKNGRFPGDEPLENDGPIETSALVAVLGRIDRIYSAPALRARQTAAKLPGNVMIETALRECDYGRWQGLRIADLQATDADSLMAWMTDFSAAPHGGEAMAAVIARVGAWMSEHLGDAGHSVVVTHASVIRAAVLQALHAAPEAFWRIDIEPLSITEMTSDGRRWQLRLARTIV